MERYCISACSPAEPFSRTVLSLADSASHMTCSRRAKSNVRQMCMSIEISLTVYRLTRAPSMSRPNYRLLYVRTETRSHMFSPLCASRITQRTLALSACSTEIKSALLSPRPGEISSLLFATPSGRHRVQIRTLLSTSYSIHCG
ncbi:hypothetical protein PYCCODRAFT_410451 [Trametes coccinea BRFM310]|uniref:Uncharacterized protein n=1 Tax=Trametes coccinea (strain BRFM310) TaxID=1353009 RepID=A0A1Y2IM54_TRAC3|nr:hypothetical protein PYCCODRAFT_410451 [Trametes coccinea BRFM310]